MPAGESHSTIVETFGAQFIEHPFDAFGAERVLVAGLGGGQHEQRLQPLVLDERLLERALAIDDVDEVVHDPPLAAHDQVQVAQADVKIDDGDPLAAARKTTRDARGSRCLPHAPLAR